MPKVGKCQPRSLGFIALLSVALLCGLRELQDEQQLEIVAAHLNHNLRGDASADDARWLEELCARLGISVVVGNEHVSAIAEQHRRAAESVPADESGA